MIREFSDLTRHRPRGLRCCTDFLSDFLGFFGVEIHRDLYAGTFDEQTYHAMIGRADLQVRFDIAFGIDAHLRLREMRIGANAARVENQAAYGVR